MFLNLSLAEFPDRLKSLPNDLVELSLKNPRVKINWVPGPNTKSMKKVFPILKYLDDDDIIIDTDDDIIMPSGLIQSRVSDFSKKQTAISSNFGAKFMGGYAIHPVWATSLFQKKMLNGW